MTAIAGAIAASALAASPAGADLVPPGGVNAAVPPTPSVTVSTPAATPVPPVTATVPSASAPSVTVPSTGAGPVSTPPATVQAAPAPASAPAPAPAPAQAPAPAPSVSVGSGGGGGVSTPSVAVPSRATTTARPTAGEGGAPSAASEPSPPGASAPQAAPSSPSSPTRAARRSGPGDLPGAAPVRTDAPTILDAPGTPPEVVSGRVRRLVERLHGCLAALPAAERRVLALRAGTDTTAPRSRAAVAEMTGLPPRTVRRLERRGIRALLQAGDDGRCAGAAGAAPIGAPVAAFGPRGPVTLAAVALRAPALGAPAPRNGVLGTRAHGGSGGSAGGESVAEPPSAVVPPPSFRPGKGGVDSAPTAIWVIVALLVLGALAVCVHAVVREMRHD